MALTLPNYNIDFTSYIMDFIKTEIEGVIIIEPKVYTDARGYFFESFVQKEFNLHIGDVDFVQDNESRSVRGVVRGLHFQAPPFTQSKLVRCTLGRVLDVAVDLRAGSPTYGRHISVELSADDHRQLFIPHGFAHGFSVLSDIAVFQYKCDNYYSPQNESGIHPLDPELSIDWRVNTSEMIMSDKDLSRQFFASFKSPF